MSVENIRKIQTSLDVDRTDIHDSHGVYRYDDDNITVISQPTFKDTLEAIEDQRPTFATIVTPELSLLDNAEFEDFSKERQSREDTIKLLSERFRRLKDVSYDSGNIIMMGAPVSSIAAKGSYNNGVVTALNGSIVHTQRKNEPGPHEEALGWFEYQDDPNRYNKMGSTALICSELLLAVLKLDDTVKANTERLLVPAAWGVTSTTPEAVERHGGVDEYNQYMLDTSAKLAALSLPNLNSVYIADRPVNGNKPQIGRLKIDR